MQSLTKLLRTTTFRLAAVYLVVFALSVGAILAYVYWNTAGLLGRQTDETIRAEVTGLAEQYRQGGLRRLVRTVAARSRDAGVSVYLVADFTGGRIAGNMTGIPDGLTDTDEGWVEFPYRVGAGGRAGQHIARAYHTRLPSGFLLVVGRDIEEKRQFARIIRRTLFLALGLTVVFGVGGGLLMSRNFLQRIDRISNTSRAIIKGDLSERMPVSGSGDELDRLAAALNEMLAQIERLMAGMREVTDNIAHDLKSPLTRLRARIEAALRGATKESYRAALEETLEEADHLLKTFDALLHIARTEAGEARATIAAVNLAEVVGDVAELYEPSIDAAGGTLRTPIDKDLTVEADRHLLAQALSNLLDNALKYGAPATPARGCGQVLKITITARRAGDMIEIAVADNGPGIPAADRKRVVERFVRLDRSRSQPGSGLGLSLVAGIASLHGGTLALKANRPGLKAVLALPASNPA